MVCNSMLDFPPSGTNPTNASGLHVVGAFLVNSRALPFLSQYEIHQVSLPNTVRRNSFSPSLLFVFVLQVTPRLAEAVMDVMDRRELRKSLRGVFEAGQYVLLSIGARSNSLSLSLSASAVCVLSTPAQQ